MKILKKPALPKGFKACGIYSGIKKAKKKDLGLIYSEASAKAAGMFTSNKVKSASLLVCKDNLKSKESKAIIVNSGNANCFVGDKGVVDAKNTISALAEELNISVKSILIASTGIIGRPLPVNTIKQTVPKLCQSLSNNGLSDFSDAILTTDTFRKIVSVEVNLKGRPVIITGVAKGAGMIYPKLEDSKHATMLAFIITDAVIKKELLSKALAKAVDASFNSITIDGCTSTNDTVLLLANGAAENPVVNNADKDFVLFVRALSYVCQELSLMIVNDAEGATKHIKISIKGARSIKEAKLAGQAIANSNLFKAAMFGGDPNWGRIVAAIGAAGIEINQNKLEVSFNSQKVFNKGEIYPLKTENLLKLAKEINLEVNLNQGGFSYVMHTCDLTPGYVKINAAYN